MWPSIVSAMLKFEKKTKQVLRLMKHRYPKWKLLIHLFIDSVITNYLLSAHHMAGTWIRVMSDGVDGLVSPITGLETHGSYCYIVVYGL